MASQDQKVIELDLSDQETQNLNNNLRTVEYTKLKELLNRDIATQEVVAKRLNTLENRVELIQKGDLARDIRTGDKWDKIVSQTNRGYFVTIGSAVGIVAILGISLAILSNRN